MSAWQSPNGGRSQAPVDAARAGLALCRVCRSQVPSNPTLSAGGPTEQCQGATWYVVTCRPCADGMARGAFEELLAAVTDAEWNWRLDDLLELRARHEGWVVRRCAT